MLLDRGREMRFWRCVRVESIDTIHFYYFSGPRYLLRRITGNQEVSCHLLPYTPYHSSPPLSFTMKLDWQELKLTPDATHGVPLKRSSHGVSLLRRGTVLFVYGGEHIARTPIEPASQTAWKADLVKQQWHAVIDTNNVGPSPRVAHAQAVHQDSVVYVFGGRAGITMQESPLNDLWSWNVDTETWTEIKPVSGTPPEARSFHRMVCVGDALYVFGGCGASGRLADLHKFDLTTQTWYTLPPSTLRGRGGTNLCALSSSQKLLVWAGFAGEETRDGQLYDIATQMWQTVELSEPVRPRSVCVAGILSLSDDDKERIVIFGGEVNPSDLGHEGAGGFAQDVVLFQASADDSAKLACQQGDALGAPPVKIPRSRGWSAGDTFQNSLYLFGGLTGDDSNPTRLDDLWKLTVQK